MAMMMVYLSLFSFHFSLSHAQHYVGPSLSAGFVQATDNLSQTRGRLSGGGETGIAYQFKRKHFLLTTGVHYSLQCPTLALDSQWLEQAMIDTRGVAVTYRGLLINRTDQLIMHQLSVPVMVGGYWSGFYLQVGLKLSVSMAAQARERASLRTAGDYNGRYYEWFEEMPNHGYHDFEPVRSSQSATLSRIDLRLSGELGYSLLLQPYSDRKPSPSLRIGLFAEYGMINMLSSAAGGGQERAPRTTADWSQYLTVSMNHIYTSDEAAKARANMLFFGIRLTLLFPVAPAQNPYKCRCTDFLQ